jgi:hypothetical protein
MTLSELFEKVYALPTDQYGLLTVKTATIHVYRTTGTQFNIEGFDGLPTWNVIKNDHSVLVVPVRGGASQWESGKSYSADTDISVLPIGIRLPLKVIGVIERTR